jgi:hypothetical protein
MSLFQRFVDHPLRYRFLFPRRQTFNGIGDLVRQPIDICSTDAPLRADQDESSCEMTNGRTIQTITANPSAAGQPKPKCRISVDNTTAVAKLKNQAIRRQRIGMFYSPPIGVAAPVSLRSALDR